MKGLLAIFDKILIVILLLFVIGLVLDTCFETINIIGVVAKWIALTIKSLF